MEKIVWDLSENGKNIIKKMADYRNHRRFTLKCIKASITSVSCKLKNPLMSKKSIDIIHKAEKQLLYECMRNINKTIETLDKQRDSQYKKFKDTVSNSNKHDQDLDLDRCRLFINKIKDHRHDKIKEEHIEKFERLYFKCYGYQYNLNRCTNNSGNIDSEQNTLSGQPNVPSSISRTSTTASNPTTAPATPMAPTPSNGTTDSNPAPRLPPSITNHMCTDCTDKWGHQPFQNPPHQGTIIPSTKRTQLCHHPQIPPHWSLHNSHWTSILQVTSPGSRWVQIRSQQNTQTTASTTQ